LSHRTYRLLSLALGLFSLGSIACSASGDGGSETKRNPSTNGGSSSNNGGGPDLTPTAGTLPTLGGSPGTGGAGSGECGQVLPVIYRDFNVYGMPGGHADFEASARGVKNMDGTTFEGWNDIGCGLVEPTLGADGKPVAFTGMPDKVEGTNLPTGIIGKQQRVTDNSEGGCWPATTGVCKVGTCIPWKITPPTHSIESATTFAQWYTTTPNVNMEVPGELLLTETMPGVSTYDTTEFFPLDGKGFGNTAGQTHNYHFTTEIHVKFKYEAGQKFTFRGDDDLWIFVNNKLALDVGGQHQALQGTIDFDAQAATLGITPGNAYPMDIFHAERQTSESNFRIETNIKCFEPVVK
jgi:fibro-slime domain-containing protein